jgi:hypothetical protein
MEGDEAHGFPEGAEGDVEGVGTGGGVVKAVQAEGQEFQMVHEGILDLPVFPEDQLLAEVAGVAAEGGRGEAVGRGQGAVRDAGQEAPVDLGPGGVIADSTTFIHLRTVFGFQFSVFGKRIRIRRRLAGEGAGGQHGWDGWR